MINLPPQPYNETFIPPAAAAAATGCTTTAHIFNIKYETAAHMLPLWHVLYVHWLQIKHWGAARLRQHTSHVSLFQQWPPAAAAQEYKFTVSVYSCCCCCCWCLCTGEATIRDFDEKITKHVGIIDFCLSQSLFAAMFRKPMQKSHWLFVEGAMLTSWLAYKKTSSFRLCMA